MSVNPVVAEILNQLGGQSAINNLMSPKMLSSGTHDLGIRLKRANKDKINHIHITDDEEGAYNVAFWVFPKKADDYKRIALYGNVKGSDLKKIIEKHTHFIFPKQDQEKNKEIANTILNQIGGVNSINAMLGIDTVQVVDNGVSVTFKVGAADEINNFTIILDEWDTYTIKYLKIKNGKNIEVDQSAMIYCDMLISELENRLQCALIMPKFI